jgi:hypothetical protein
MNQISNEKKLQTTLQIPISKVEIHNSYAELYSDGQKIGSVPITQVGSTIVFDTGEQSIANLKWGIVFNKYRDKFATLAKSRTPEVELEVVPAMYGHIYVRNTDGRVVGYYKCVYDGADWNIFPAIGHLTA